MASEQSECVSRGSVIDQIIFFTKLFVDLCVAWVLTIRDLFTSRRKSVNGQVVVITGGAGAIGKAVGEMFANLGAKVALLDLNEKAVKEAANEINENAGLAVGFVCDCTKLESMKEVANKVRNHHELGEVDILLCCAGILISKPIVELTTDDIKRTFDVNTLGDFWTIQAFLPAMLDRNKGHIAAVSSAAAYFGTSLAAAYSASKFAIRGLMESLEWELQDLQKTGIRTTTIYPYFTQTPLLNSCSPSSRFFGNLPIDCTANSILDAILYEHQEYFVPNYMSRLCVFIKEYSPVRVKAVWRKFFNVVYYTTSPKQ